MTARGRAVASEPPGAPADVTADLAVLARVVARLVVAVSKGPNPASFRAIATRELRVASDSEVDVIERLCGGG